MRGRILLAIALSVAAMAACSRKDSIYIEPGKRDGATSEPPKPAEARPAPAKSEPAKSEPAKPAQSPPARP